MLIYDVVKYLSILLFKLICLCYGEPSDGLTDLNQVCTHKQLLSQLSESDTFMDALFGSLQAKSFL